MFRFPFGTLQELNLDWIIEKIREFAETGTKTKEPLTFQFSDGTEKTFDGEEAVTIDLAGADISGKLDKYTGGVDTVYATIGSNQTNLPLPLGANYGGTGVTSLAALKTALGLALEYVARRTTVGAWVYTHDGSTEGEKPLGYTPSPDSIAVRNADSNVQTSAPQADNDAVNRKYFNDNAEILGNKDSAIVAADESSTTKYPSIKGIVDWCNNKFEVLTNKVTAISAADETSTTKYPAIKAIVDWCNNKFEVLTNKVTAIATADETSTTKYPAIKAIVDWANAKFQTPTDKTVTIASPWVRNTGDNRTRCYVQNNVCYLCIALYTAASNVTPNTEINIASIPADCAPKYSLDITGHGVDNGLVTLAVKTDGTMTASVSPTAMGSTNVWVWAWGGWVIDK